jgi:hypothetical protein
MEAKGDSMKNWFTRSGLMLALIGASLLAVAPAIAAGLGEEVAKVGGSVDWGKILESILVVVITTVVPLVVYAFINLLTYAKDWLKAKEKESWFYWAGGIVADAVLSTSQTLGEQIKEAAKDGKFTDEEKAMLFNTAKDLAFKNLGVIPGKFLPMIEGWIRAKIEAELAKLKIFQKMGPASLPPVGVPAAAPSPVR